MHQTYFDRLLKDRDRLATIAGDYQSPLVREVRVCKRSANQPTTRFSIKPKPSVEQPINSRSVQVYREANISIELEDIQVTGISATYKRNQLVGAGVYYEVEGEDGEFFVADKIQGYDLKRNGLTWTLLLRRRK